MVEFLPSKQAVASSSLVSRFLCVHRLSRMASKATSPEVCFRSFLKETISFLEGRVQGHPATVLGNTLPRAKEKPAQNLGALPHPKPS